MARSEEVRTKVCFEVELDVEGLYIPGRPAVYDPPPGEPAEPDYAQALKVLKLTIDGQDVFLEQPFLAAILGVLEMNSTLRDKIEEAIAEEARDG